MKKGQLTIFIILGFIILILVGLSMFLVFNSTDTLNVPDEEFTADRAGDLASLVAEVESCMSSLTTESLQKLSLQGGHLNVDDFRYDVVPSYRNNAISVFDDGSEIVPIWQTLNDDFKCSACEYENNFVSLEGIQAQVENYVFENLESCANGFVDFRNRFDVQYEDIGDVEVIFTQDDVVTNLIWEMEVLNEETDRVTDISRFQTSVDIPFRKIYETAYDIYVELVLVDNKFAHYMRSVRDFVVFADDLPPSYTVTYNSFENYKAYNLLEGQEVLNKELYQNMDALQLIGSKNSYWLEEPDDVHMDKLYEDNRFFLEDNSFLGNVDVNFDYYPHWGGFLSVWPSNGPVVLPEVSYFSLFLFSATDIVYDLRYDMSYPFMISLSHDDSLGGQGFDFRFGVEANMQRNRGMGEAEIISTNEETQVFANLLDPRQSSIPLEYTVRDGFTTLPRSGFDVYYQCNDQKLFLGTSDSSGKVSGEVFPCIDAHVTIQDDLARSEVDRFTLVLGNEYEREIFVYEPVEVEVDFKKLGVRKTNLRSDGGIPVWDYELTNYEIEIDDSDEFFLIMTSLSDYEIPFVQVLEINGSDVKNRENNTIMLLPDDFEMFAFSKKNILAVSGKDKIELDDEVLDPDDDVSIGPVTLRSGSTTKINGTNISESLMDGYFALDSSNDRFYSVQAADLTNENPVMTVYLKSFDPFYNVSTDSEGKFAPDGSNEVSDSELVPYVSSLLTFTREMDILGEIADIKNEDIGQLEPVIRNE